MRTSRRADGAGALTRERAYELAQSGQCVDLNQLKARLKAEGYATVLTDLRSHIVRRELRALCARSALQAATDLRRR